MSDKIIEVGNVKPTKIEVVVREVVSEVSKDKKFSEVISDNSKQLEESSDEDLLASLVESGVIKKFGKKYSFADAKDALTLNDILAKVSEDKLSLIEAVRSQLINVSNLIDVCWSDKLIVENDETKSYEFNSIDLGSNWEDIPSLLCENHDLLVEILLACLNTEEKSEVIESVETPVVTENAQASVELVCVKNNSAKTITLVQGADRYVFHQNSTIPLMSIPLWVRRHVEYHSAVKEKSLVVGTLKNLVNNN